jgi:hypothetical protein
MKLRLMKSSFNYPIDSPCLSLRPCTSPTAIRQVCFHYALDAVSPWRESINLTATDAVKNLRGNDMKEEQK